MLIEGIDFPDELLRAQIAGELVIFAGAGVSRPEPSNLPLFDALAKKIGAHSGVVREQLRGELTEPDDRYLGRLRKGGVKVHEKAAQILVGPHTQPHELHQLLLKVFPSAGAVRLVTTNFDTHFSTSAAAVFDFPVETYFAPALPLGDDFAGLVYLHGRADHDPKRCILTDEDFGRAYLTQAWASRFLSAMFSRYAVLFVGYSHNDTVMNYLARGLPPSNGKRRFAFTADESLSKWEFLGIHPMVYQRVDGDNRHQPITDAVGRWVGELRSGLLDKAQRIRAIAETQPPLEGEDGDYLRFSLTQIETARIFLKYARLPEWIGWLEKAGLLKPLFQPHTELGKFERELVFWLTEHFFTTHAHSLWAAIQRNGGILHNYLCWCIWRRLCTRHHDDAITNVFFRWIAILLSQTHSVLSCEDCVMLLKVCRFPEDARISTLLFDHVTTPRVSLKPSWRAMFEGNQALEEVDFKLSLVDAGEHRLREAWEDVFKPNLKDCATALEPVVTANLSAAYVFQLLGNNGVRDHDPFYLDRQSIEAHDQHCDFKPLDLLVDTAREILRLRLESEPDMAATQIANWFGSDVPILRRVAIHGFAQRNDISSDAKLQWLIGNRLLYQFKTDVFCFLRHCFQSASDNLRREVVNQALQGPNGECFVNLKDRDKQYVTYNLIVWLQKIAPECNITGEALALLKRQNPDFEPREHPDLDFWSSGFKWSNEVEDLDGDRLQAIQPPQLLDNLLNARQVEPFENGRASCCAKASAIIAGKPAWGLEWAATLVARGLSDDDLWTALCQGWRNANLTPDDWKLVLGFASSTQAPPSFFEAFAEVLENGSRREQNAIPNELMDQAQQVAKDVWRLALENSVPAESSFGDWLTNAINRPGGKLAEFWLQRLSVARKLAGDSWKSIPLGIAEDIRLMLRGTSGAAAYARIVLASQLHYFFSLDSEFARAEILPLFDWKKDSVKAEQCWHGFLYWGRWLPGFKDQLLPHFDGAIDRLDQLPKETRQALLKHVASLALFGMENPLAKEWLMIVIQKLQKPDLDQLASNLDRFLTEANTTAAEGIWTRWLRDYWNLRLFGTPIPLTGKEANETACLALSVGRYFPEAVKLVLSMGESVSFEHTGLLYRIDKKDLAKTYPDAAADLVLFFLSRPQEHFYPDEHVANIWQSFLANGVCKTKLKKIREALFRLGHDPDKPCV